MVIVAGQIFVNPAQRERYLADCVSVVEQARHAQRGASISRSLPTFSSQDGSTLSNVGRLRRPSRPFAAAAQAKSRAR